MVVLVEVIRKAYLASIVPVIVNAILNEHQVVVDIIAFVSKGDFPRSRLGEKQRGKILAGWVTRKMRTIAQFSIRDADGVDSQITEVPEERMHSPSGLRQGSSTLGDGNTSGGNTMSEPSPIGTDQGFTSIPKTESHTPANNGYENSIMESPPLVPDKVPLDRGDPVDTQNAFYGGPPNNQDTSPSVYSPYEVTGDYYNNHFDPDETPHAERSGFDYDSNPPAPRFDSKPTLSSPSNSAHVPPDLEGKTWGDAGQKLQRPPEGTRQREYSWEPGTSGSSKPGGLRVANMGDNDEVEWPQEALAQMRLAGGGSKGSRGAQRQERYDGSGYGDDTP